MKPKQLANVLLKILGLSLVAHDIPGLIDGIVNWLQFTSDNHFSPFNGIRGNSHFGMIVLLNLVPFAVGFALIVYSRWLTNKLFKDESE